MQCNVLPLYHYAYPKVFIFKIYWKILITTTQSSHDCLSLTVCKIFPCPMPKIQVLTFPHIIPLSFKLSKKENNKKLLSTYVTKNNDMTKKLLMTMLFYKKGFSLSQTNCFYCCFQNLLQWHLRTGALGLKLGNFQHSWLFWHPI